jgi:hypothetical protein
MLTAKDGLELNIICEKAGLTKADFLRQLIYDFMKAQS